MSHKIDFSHNWNNKLSNDIFTTIRKWTYSKEMYYKDLIAMPFEVVLNGRVLGIAKLINVEIKEYINIEPTMLRLDVGKEDINEINEVFNKFGIDKSNNVLILTFAKGQLNETESK